MAVNRLAAASLGPAGSLCTMAGHGLAPGTNPLPYRLGCAGTLRMQRCRPR